MSLVQRRGNADSVFVGFYVQPGSREPGCMVEVGGLIQIIHNIETNAVICIRVIQAG